MITTTGPDLAQMVGGLIAASQPNGAEPTQADYEAQQQAEDDAAIAKLILRIRRSGDQQLIKLLQRLCEEAAIGGAGSMVFWMTSGSTDYDNDLLPAIKRFVRRDCKLIYCIPKR